MRPERPAPLADPTNRQRDQLATFLVGMLSLLFGGSFIVFLIFVSLGLFLWVIVTAAGIAVFTGLHYLVWGRTVRPVQPPNHEITSDVPSVRSRSSPGAIKVGNAEPDDLIPPV
jgi:hypothetical protein